MKAFKEGHPRANGVHAPNDALSLNDGVIELRKRVKEQGLETRRLKDKMNVWKKQVLFSQPAVGSQHKTGADVYCN